MAALRRTAALLLVVLVTSVAGTGPASAGGPTSVLLSSPDKERVAALYYSDSDYQRLMQHVESKGPGAQTLPADSDSPHGSAPAPVAEPSKAEAGTMTGWRWSIPGFVVGGLLVAMAVHLLARRREQEPRWQLIDAE